VWAIHSVGKPITLYTGTVTQAGQSSPFNVDGWIEAQIFIDVTAASGTLSLSVETGPDSEDFYPKHTVISDITTTGKVSPVKLTNFGKWLRLKWDISAGGSFTFKAIFLGKS